jgi:hypothetical protein
MCQLLHHCVNDSLLLYLRGNYNTHANNDNVAATHLSIYPSTKLYSSRFRVSPMHAGGLCYPYQLKDHHALAGMAGGRRNPAAVSYIIDHWNHARCNGDLTT